MTLNRPGLEKIGPQNLVGQLTQPLIKAVLKSASHQKTFTKSDFTLLEMELILLLN